MSFALMGFETRYHTADFRRRTHWIPFAAWKNVALKGGLPSAARMREDTQCKSRKRERSRSKLLAHTISQSASLSQCPGDVSEKSTYYIRGCDEVVWIPDVTNAVFNSAVMRTGGL